MSSTAIQGYGSSYTSGLDSLGGVDGADSQNEIEQFLELLIEELQQMLSQSAGSNDDDSSGGVGGVGASSPASYTPAATTGDGGGGGGGGVSSPAATTPSTQAAGTTGGTTGTTGGTTTGGGSTVPNVTSSDPAQAIAQDLESRYGLNDAQVAGVLGNLQQESGLQGDINQGGAKGAPSSNFADDNGNGWGLAQWGGARKQGEIDYANQHGLDPGSLEANIGYMNKELDTTNSKTISDIKQTSTPEDAALVWDKDYEQASDPQMQNRNQFAEQFYAQGL